jgi:integrase
MSQEKAPDQKGEKKKTQKAEPIRSLKAVKQIIRTKLKCEPRNRLLFVIGINTWLRIGTLLELKVKDVRGKKKGDRHYFDYPESQKPRYLEINAKIKQELKAYFAKKSPKDDEYLFASRKGNDALTIGRVDDLIKEWTVGIESNGHYTGETLRATFGFLQRTEFGVGLDVLSKRYGHKSPAATVKLLGISEDDPINILDNKIG